jgi:acetylornithine deacetylase/succinyl-diaminopimelate desuccinylase-like protein
MVAVRFAASVPAAVASVLLLGTGAAPPDLHDEVDRYRRSAEPAIVRELAELVAIPNVASDLPNIQRNADHLAGMLRARGVEARLLENPGAPPAVYGELRSPGAKRTIVFYAHYDGQPVDPAQWKTPPWTPVLRDKPLDQGGRDLPLPAAGQPLPEEARLYGRSASDDKAPIVAMLTALDALKAAHVAPSINLKFYFEGEEEAESTHLKESLERNRDLLKADAWIFCDGPVHQSRRMEVVYGARGVLPLELTVYGPTRALHDGHYGNWAPNPAALLATLLAGMRDPDGRVTVAGFYDGVRPINDLDRRAIAQIPSVDPELRRSLGLARTEADDAPLAERVMLPALNLRGLSAGHVGAQAANAIPVDARASLDIRLVPDQKPEAVREAVERHLAAQGYFIARDEPDLTTRLAHPRIVRVEWKAGYPGVRIAMDQPFARAVGAVVAEGLGGAPIVNLPILGGSLPLYTLQDVLKTPVVIVPIVNHDNNQHAANENLRLRNLWDGIQIFAALFARLGPAWS